MIIRNLSRARKPRIALMGEFSAGKSTLANLLLGEDLSPVQATATQLPAIWYSYGEPGTFRLCADGVKEPIDADDLRSISPDTTKMLSVSAPSDFLQACDLIDMPGTSDPNMAANYWEDVLPQVDGVIWCTSATQAWRQSEAALWERVPETIWKNSLLLITRMDKMITERDKIRVQKRVEHAVEGQFADVVPIALLPAVQNRTDPSVLSESGASLLFDRIEALIARLGNGETRPLRAIEEKPPIVEKKSEPQNACPEDPKIMPRRVVRDPSTVRRLRRTSATARP